MLDHSKLAYAQLVAANALKKLLMQSWNHLSVQQRIDLRNYVLTYLANNGPDCQVRVRVRVRARARAGVRVRVRVRARARGRVRVSSACSTCALG